jgi:hypothetical protein
MDNDNNYRQDDQNTDFDDSLIIVYVLTNDPESQRLRSLHSLFSGDLYHFRIIQYDKMTTNKNNNSNNKNDIIDYNLSDVEETKLINLCLNDANRKFYNNSIIIIKDSSITTSSAWEISKIILDINSRPQWDLCYLCSWLDVCEMYTDFYKIPDTSVSLVKAYAPEGIQALMISANGRKHLLKLINTKQVNPINSISEYITKNIVNEKLIAYNTVPNLFNYDLSLAKNNSDYKKANSCLITISGNKNNKNTNNKGFLVTNYKNSNSVQYPTISPWLLLGIFLLIILIICGIIYYNKRKSTYIKPAVISAENTPMNYIPSNM